MKLQYSEFKLYIFTKFVYIETNNDSKAVF